MDQRPTRQWRDRTGRGDVSPDELALIMDHTILKAEAGSNDIDALCREALAYGFGAVCVNSVHVPRAVGALGRTEGGRPGVCAVVGFPLGAAASEVKAFEAAWAVRHGAREIDMVISVGHLKSGDAATVQADIRAVVAAAREAWSARGHGVNAPEDGETGVLIKVILETGYLTDEEKVEACRRAAAAGADFVKTSTGFGPGGATAADVSLMRRAVGEELGVKASGGIRDLDTALSLVAAGADRLGLSAGVAVLKEARARAGLADG